jgi:hypothetical protein
MVGRAARAPAAWASAVRQACRRVAADVRQPSTSLNPPAGVTWRYMYGPLGTRCERCGDAFLALTWWGRPLPDLDLVYRS